MSPAQYVAIGDFTVFTNAVIVSWFITKIFIAIPCNKKKTLYNLPQTHLQSVPLHFFLLTFWFTIMELSYKELLQQRQALERQIKDARNRELSDAVSRVRELIVEYELTETDIFPRGRGSRVAAPYGVVKAKVAPKYRNPATGQTWTGRGKPPRWIQTAEDRAKYTIV